MPKLSYFPGLILRQVAKNWPNGRLDAYKELCTTSQNSARWHNPQIGAKSTPKVNTFHLGLIGQYSGFVDQNRPAATSHQKLATDGASPELTPTHTKSL